MVNDIAASKTGAFSILTDFYHYIAKHDTDNEWIFLLGGPFIEETDRIQVRVMQEVKKSWMNRLKFDLFTGASYIRALQPDVVFSLQNTVTFGYRGKQVVYVHQPLGFQTVKRFSFLKRSEREYAVYQHLIGAMINASIRKADRVIVQTKWMRDAVIKKAHVSGDKVTQILPDVENLNGFIREGIRKGNQFFFPSGVMIYKNHECILKACTLLNERGFTDFNVLFTIDDMRAVTDYVFDNRYDNISTGGRLTKEEVLDAYNERTLIFPSYIETFGYPLAEARQFGAPILASDCPFCTEVLEGYGQAYYFDPFRAKELADLMQRSIEGTLYSDRNDVAQTKLSEVNQHRDSWAEVLGVVTGVNS
ncbi:MAG: glycosyltransferase [bacterium]|nr:glycosyltransferase [bacterium]